MMHSAVALLRTRPETVVEDYGRLMRLVKYDQVLRRDPAVTRKRRDHVGAAVADRPIHERRAK